MTRDVEKLAALRQIMVDRLSESDLRNLSFDSGVDYQDLPATTRVDFARELLLYHIRHNTLDILIRVSQRLRPDMDWSSITSASYEYSITRSESIIYDSRYEDPVFASWTYYGNLQFFDQRIKITSNHPDGIPTFDLSCPSNEHVGANKSLRTLSGKIRFEYNAILSDHLTSNILFCVIPMQEPGIGRAGLIEVGTNIQGDPKNAFSQYRKRLFVPKDHIGDGKWHQASIDFDFRQIETAYYSIFGPRINEGCHTTGSGRVLVANIQAIV